MAKQQGISKEAAEAAELVNQSYKQGLITLGQMESLLDKILSKQLKSKEAVLEAVIAEEQQKDLIEGQNKLLDRKIAKELETIKNNEDLTSILNTQKQNTEDLTEGLADMADLSAQQAKNKLREIQAQKQQLKQQFSYRNLTWEQKEAYSNILKNLESQEAILGNLSKLQGNKQAKALAGAFESANDAVDEMQTNLDETFAKIPGGGMLGKVLGVDDFSKKMKGEVTKSFAAMNQEIAKGGGLMGALKTGMSGFNKIVMMNPLLLVVAAGAALFKILSKNEEMSREFSKNTGLDYANSQRLVESTRARSTILDEQLATTEDLLAVQSQTISQMGLAGKLSNETASAVAETGMAFGYGAEKAGEVQATMMKLGASQQEAASAQKEIAAEAMKAGVNVGAVMDDVAKNSANAARYMGSNVKEITKAALEAAKLGMSLDTMAGIADGLLNIEDSLTAQFEYQALSGKQLNLDKARQLALEGDLVGMAKEVASQAGDIHEFNKMGRFEREKLAASMGMEVGQLQEMLAMEEARKKIGPELADQAKQLGLTADEMANMSADELQNKIAQKQQAASMSKVMSDIADTLTSLLLPVAQVLADVFNMILGVVQLILYPFRMAADYLTNMGTAGQALLTAIKFMGVAYLVYLGYKKVAAMLDKRKAKKQLEEFELQQRIAKMKEQELKTQKAINNEKQKGNAASGDTVKQLQQKQKGGIMGRLKGGVGKLLGGAKSLLTPGNIMMGAGALGMGSALFGGGEAEQTGDLKINPNGGPVVASPREGGIYQGTKNDGLAMAPGAEGGGGPAIDYQALGAAVAAALAANPPVINLDGKQVSDTVSAQQSYDRGIK